MPRNLLVEFHQALVLNLVKYFLEIQLYHDLGTSITPKLLFTPYNCSSFPEASVAFNGFGSRNIKIMMRNRQEAFCKPDDRRIP